MKKALAPVLILLMAIMLTGCSQSPESTAQSFLENLAEGKIDKAKDYATSQTGQLLDMVSSMGGVPVNPDFNFIFVEKTVDGNKAVVKYKEADDGEVQDINLVKLDGKWKVYITK